MEEGKDHFAGLMEDSQLEAEDLWKDCNGQRRIEAGQGQCERRKLMGCISFFLLLQQITPHHVSLCFHHHFIFCLTEPPTPRLQGQWMSYNPGLSLISRP